MELSQAQLEAIASHAGERLKEYRVHPGGRYTLGLPGGDRLTLLTFATPQAATAARAAIDMLRGEVDLPLPQARMHDAAGLVGGAPWLLTNELAGEPLSAVLQRIPDDQLYKLGRRLGEIAYRIHRVACAHYGALVRHDDAAADDERSYVLARVEIATAEAQRAWRLADDTAAVIRSSFERTFHPPGTQPALVWGGFAPESVLVRQAGEGWSVSGLTDAKDASGGSPAWEHTLLFDAFDARRYFSVRVGYGNAYDLETRRAYEQVREVALRPYRALLSLERLATSAPSDLQRLQALLMQLITYQDS